MCQCGRRSWFLDRRVCLMPAGDWQAIGLNVIDSRPVPSNHVASALNRRGGRDAAWPALSAGALLQCRLQSEVASARGRQEYGAGALGRHECAATLLHGRGVWVRPFGPFRGQMEFCIGWQNTRSERWRGFMGPVWRCANGIVL